MFLRLLPLLPVILLAACQPYPVAVADGIELIDPASVDLSRLTPASPLSPKPYKVRRSAVVAAPPRPAAYRSSVMTASHPASGPAVVQRSAAAPAPKALPLTSQPVAPQRPAPPSVPARSGLDVYRSQSEVRDLHRVIGEVRLSTDGRESAQSIRSSFERQARARDAQGVIIQDPADRPYAGSPGPGFDQPREITAIFIRYDDQRSSSRSAPAPPSYSSRNPSAFGQNPAFPLQPPPDFSRQQ
ncbi:MAG: hypothetical protein V4726_14615 [Verrucomicrobiota bacterium]